MTTAKRYRKKPVEIEARQLGISRDDDVETFYWCGGKQPPIGTEEDILFYIPTLEGDMAARSGDYIIRGVKGEFYPCRADVFAATYEEV